MYNPFVIISVVLGEISKWSIQARILHKRVWQNQPNCPLAISTTFQKLSSKKVSWPRSRFLLRYSKIGKIIIMRKWIIFLFSRGGHDRVEEPSQSPSPLCNKSWSETLKFLSFKNRSFPMECFLMLTASFKNEFQLPFQFLSFKNEKV